MVVYVVYVEKPNGVVLEKKYYSKTKAESDELWQNNYLLFICFFVIIHLFIYLFFI